MTVMTDADRLRIAAVETNTEFTSMPSPLLHFDRCLIRERLVAAMARARYCRDAGLPADWVAAAVHEARCWSHTLVQAHRAARARS